MPDKHTHEWRIMATIPYLDSHCRPFAYCRDTDCNANLEKEEIERRLSATERLSAERAKNAGVWIHIAFDSETDNLEAVKSYQDSLLAYAAALEKE